MINDDKNKNIDEQSTEPNTETESNTQADVKATEEIVETKAKKQNFTKKRSFKFGSMATAFTAIFIAIVILLNVGITILAQKYPMNIDLTKDKDYGISQMSIDYVKKINTPIKITFFASKDAFSSNYMQPLKVIEEFSKHNSNISIEYIDYDKNPTAVAAFPDEDIAEYDLVVSAEVDGKSRYKHIALKDLYLTQVNQQTYQTQVIGLQAEQQIDSAIDYVTSDKLPKMVFTEGHSEAPSTDLQTLYKNANYQVSTIALASKELTADTDALVIVAPQADFSNDEITKIDTWVKNDGKYGKNVFVYLDPRLETMPVLEGYLEEWGVKAETGVIYDKSNNFNNSTFNPMASSVNTDVAGKDISTDIKTAVTSARPLTLTFENKGNRTTSKVIEVGESAQVMKDLTAKTSGSDPKGPFTVMTRTTMGDANNVSNMIVSGSYEIGVAAQLNESNKNNTKVLTGIANTLMEKKPSITAPSKYNDTATLSLTTVQRILIIVLFTVIVPIALIILGIVVWLRRRHL